MKLTVLGKYGPYGKAGVGAASGYLIRDDNFCILLDMGSGVLSRLIAEVDVKQLDGIFISHLHYDHTSDLLPFRYLLEETGVKMKIFTSPDDSDWYKMLFNHPLFDVTDVTDGQSLTVKDKKLTFFEMKHPVYDLAVKIEGGGVFSYTGDTNFNANLYPLLNGADVAVADCSKPAGFVGGHMTVTEAIRLKRETNVKLLIASHAAPDYDPEKDFENTDGLVSAEELKTYYVR
jgi:ribonuclease BN (tRNA processing enzyme)